MLRKKLVGGMIAIGALAALTASVAMAHHSYGSYDSNIGIVSIPNGGGADSNFNGFDSSHRFDHGTQTWECYGNTLKACVDIGGSQDMDHIYAKLDNAVLYVNPNDPFNNTWRDVWTNSTCSGSPAGGHRNLRASVYSEDDDTYLGQVTFLHATGSAVHGSFINGGIIEDGEFMFSTTEGYYNFSAAIDVDWNGWIYAKSPIDGSCNGYWSGPHVHYEYQPYNIGVMDYWTDVFTAGAGTFEWSVTH